MIITQKRLKLIKVFQDDRKRLITEARKLNSLRTEKLHRQKTLDLCFLYLFCVPVADLFVSFSKWVRFLQENYKKTV